MQKTLVILAAGMGSRFGGLKQVEPVGPAGETLLDYSIHDARAAGFSRVVFVIRRDFDKLFRRQVGARYESRVEIDYAYQDLDTLPKGFAAPTGRTKPWGTGHALWCAREVLEGPFTVINADDFYGARSYRALADFLDRRAVGEAALAGYALQRTLSENGAVSRGVCSIAGDGTLLSVVERKGIAPADVGPGKTFSGDEIVSMNCWAFGPEFLAGLDARLREFLSSSTTDLNTAEFYLPGSVSDLVAAKALVVRVLNADSDWFGVTYREDKPTVAAALVALTAAGVYPTPLFGA